MTVKIVERDGAGRIHVVRLSGENIQRVVTRSQAAKPDNSPMGLNVQVLDVLSSVFLPSGYPESVSPGMFISRAI